MELIEVIKRGLEARGIKVSDRAAEAIAEVVNELVSQRSCVDAETVRLIVAHPSIVRMLKVLRSRGPMITRRLLDAVHEWEYGEKILKLAARLGLVRRERINKDNKLCHSIAGCILNSITAKGLQLLEILEEGD